MSKIFSFLIMSKIFPFLIDIIFNYYITFYIFMISKILFYIIVIMKLINKIDLLSNFIFYYNWSNSVQTFVNDCKICQQENTKETM